jgi:hypothetical protein
MTTWTGETNVAACIGNVDTAMDKGQSRSSRRTFGGHAGGQDRTTTLDALAHGRHVEAQSTKACEGSASTPPGRDHPGGVRACGPASRSSHPLPGEGPPAPGFAGAKTTAQPLEPSEKSSALRRRSRPPGRGLQTPAGGPREKNRPGPVLLSRRSGRCMTKTRQPPRGGTEPAILGIR